MSVVSALRSRLNNVVNLLYFHLISFIFCSPLNYCRDISSTNIADAAPSCGFRHSSYENLYQRSSPDQGQIQRFSCNASPTNSRYALTTQTAVRAHLSLVSNHFHVMIKLGVFHYIQTVICSVETVIPVEIVILAVADLYK